ncbi:hypothetical protein [Candidatus Solirubrobacter pratensis]|uniref:hypothetical protein n=1 Tax=Candidatus Solirubrobacter pratensis TaxID=1298857 RepID=UPI0004088CBE|nr:hypothetical protein [Candidatus Solirubrobacter pratensis]
MLGAMWAVALAITVAAGVLAGRAAVSRERAAPAGDRVVRAGVATLVVPREWRSVAPDGTGLAGVPAARTAAMAPWPALPDRVIVTVAPAGDASLIPRALRRLVRDVRQGPRPTRLAGYRAWRYAGLLAPDRDVLDVTVLPTGAGVLAVACTSPPWEAGAMADCASSIRSVSLRGTAALLPARDLALRLRLPRVLAALDRARVRDRAALARAATGADQARLARRLASAHLAAAESLRPVAGRAGEPLLGELSDVAGAYSALASAASAGSALDFETARETVASAEAGLAGGIARVAPPRGRQAAVVQPSPPPFRRPAEEGADARWIALALVAFLGLLAAGLATLRARGRRGRTDPAPRARALAGAAFVPEPAAFWGVPGYPGPPDAASGAVHAARPAPAETAASATPSAGAHAPAETAASATPSAGAHAPAEAASSAVPSPPAAAPPERPLAGAAGGWDAPPAELARAAAGAAGTKTAARPDDRLDEPR